MIELDVNTLFWFWVASVWMIVICSVIANASIHARIDDLEEKLKKEKSK